MEVVALNEQLREEFAGVVKHFLTIRREEVKRVAAATGGTLVFAAAVVPTAESNVAQAKPTSVDASTKATSAAKRSAKQPQPEPETESAPGGCGTTGAPLQQQQQLSPGSLLPERTQQYATLAKTILRRANAYQYTSREHFARDISELLLLADASDQKLVLQQLVDQQHALQARPKSTKRQKVNGIRIDSAGVPGIQCRSKAQDQWACNVDMGGNTSTTSRWKSREKAEEIGYKAQVRDDLRRLPNGAELLQEMHDELAATCTKFDRDVLHDAMKQVKKRLPISKHHDVSSLTAALAPVAPPPLPSSQMNHATTPTTAAKERETKPSRKREVWTACWFTKSAGSWTWERRYGGFVLRSSSSTPPWLEMCRHTESPLRRRRPRPISWRSELPRTTTRGSRFYDCDDLSRFACVAIWRVERFARAWATWPGTPRAGKRWDDSSGAKSTRTTRKSL
jgi:hypothetical protein